MNQEDVNDMLMRGPNQVLYVCHACQENYLAPGQICCNDCDEEDKLRRGGEQ